MICNYSASPEFISNRDGELAYRTGLRQIPVKAWGRSPPDFPQRAMLCIASRGKLNSHNDSKENSLLFMLKPLSSKLSPYSIPAPKRGGEPSKKAGIPRLFCVPGKRLLKCGFPVDDAYARCSAPAWPVRVQKTPPCTNAVQGGAAFQRLLFMNLPMILQRSLSGSCSGCQSRF